MRSQALIYWSKKAFEIVLTLLIVTLLSFLLMRLSPVDPATAYVKRNRPIVTQEEVDEARVMLGLDKPLPLQYLTWLKNALSGDLGTSLRTGHSVAQELGGALPTTLAVVLLSAAVMILGIPLLGCLHYLARKNIFGHVIVLVLLAGVSIPPFYLASVYLDVFAVNLGVISVAGNTGLARYLPAALCLSVLGIALYALMLSKAMQAEMGEDYAIYLRCRGISEGRILLRHALPRAVIGLVPSFMQMLGLFMAGACVVESVFSLPGIGHLIIVSVIQRDSPMLHAEVLVLALAFVAFNILADVLRRAMNRHQAEEARS